MLKLILFVIDAHAFLEDVLSVWQLHILMCDLNFKEVDLHWSHLFTFASGSFCWISKSGKHLLYELYITMFAFGARIEICLDTVSCLFDLKKSVASKCLSMLPQLVLYVVGLLFRYPPPVRSTTVDQSSHSLTVATRELFNELDKNVRPVAPVRFLTVWSASVHTTISIVSILG